MKFRSTFFLAFALCAGLLAAEESSHTLSRVEQAPEGLSEAVSARIDPQGYRIAGPDGPLATLWLAKEIEVKEGFRPTLSVKYPLASGQFVGALQVHDQGEFTDFREQRIAPGVYTLRYAQQPMDGNHIGTSDLADFLAALPAKTDEAPGAIADEFALQDKSARAAGSTHPAIFSLLPVEDAPEEAVLKHDQSREYWVLTVAAAGKAGDQAVSLPLRLVVVGKAEF